MSANLEQPVADAPPQVEPDLGDFAADFGLDEPQSADQAGTDPTLDASEEAGAGEGGEQAAATGDSGRGEAGGDGTAGAEAQAAGAEKPAGAADPELTDDENKAVAALPEGERQQAIEKFKTARSFEGHYLNPNRPIEEVRAYLESRSKGRYGELQQAVVAAAVSEPRAFAKEFFGRDPEGYGRFVETLYDADPGYFVQRLAGREDVTAEQVQAALAFYDQHGGKAPAEGATAAADEVLSDEEMNDLREWFPDKADKWIERLKAGGQEAKPAAAAPGKEGQTGEAKEDAGKTDAKAGEAKPDAAQPDPAAVRQEGIDAGYEVISTGLEEFFADPKEIGLGISDREWELTPEVAQAKDNKLTLLVQGNERVGLVPFEEGLVKWAEGKAGFKEAFDSWVYFAGKGEKDNAKEAAARLLPFAKEYARERLKHPAFKTADALIRKALAASNPPANTETHTPGAASTVDSQRPSTSPEAALFEEAVNFNLP